MHPSGGAPSPRASATASNTRPAAPRSSRVKPLLLAKPSLRAPTRVPSCAARARREPSPTTKGPSGSVLPLKTGSDLLLGPTKPHLVRDCVFSMAYKVYCGLSSRRFSTDLLEAHENGFVSKPIPGPKVTAFFEDPYFTPILKSLIGYSARPLRAVEKDFAIDSSGFGSSRYERWYDQKYGVTRMKCIWVKTHIACGAKTNVVTAVRILDKD